MIWTITFSERILYVSEFAFNFFVFYFDIRQCGMTSRAPVNESVVPINKTLLIEAHETSMTAR